MPSIRRLLPVLWQKSGGICALCLWALDPKNLHVDHIVPKARGGTDDPDNLQVVHKVCNIRKHDSPMEEAIVRIRTTPVGHSTLKPGQTEVTLVVDRELFGRLEDFRFEHRWGSRGAAVRWLIAEALKAHGTPPDQTPRPARRAKSKA